MGEKRILLAEQDPQAATGFKQALGDQWQVINAKDGAAALAAIKHEACDVIVASLDLPGASASELLNQARRRNPDTVRFILAREEDRSRVMKELLGAHQFLVKPLDQSTLKRTIEGAMALDVWVSSESMRALVSKVRSFPAAPSIYLELLALLRSPDASTEQVAAIITKDMAITTKLLQVLNSAYFGLPNKITDPTEAVGILGFETLKSMVVAIKMLAHYDKLKTPNFSIDQLWSHSTNVAHHARQIVKMHNSGRAMAEAAYTAGLMHDMGKVVLAANFDEQYRGALSLAQKQNLPIWEVEKEIFGATHGEVGAYLLGLWGLPVELQEAAALHHYPSRSNQREFSVLTAVHVANVLEYEIRPEKTDQAPLIDEAYLEQAGVLDCLASWRRAVSTQDFTTPEIRTPAPAKEPQPSPALPLPATSVETTTISAEESEELVEVPASGNRLWLYVGAAAASVILLGGLVYKSINQTTTEPAKTPGGAGTAAKTAPVEVHARPLVPSGPSKAAEPAVVTPEPPAAKQVSTPAPALTPVAAPEPAPAASVAIVPEAPKEPAFPDLKLQGLFVSANRPAAIVNGKMLHLNESIAGARVIDIGRSNVTFEFKDQRKTLRIK